MKDEAEEYAKKYEKIAAEYTAAKAEYEAAEKVHDKIEMKFPDVKHCMVHVNPYEGDKNEKK